MIRVSRLNFSYRSAEIFSNANIVLPESGIVAVIGDNGAGKTTFLKLLTGELLPDDGTVRVDGSIAYLPQVTTELSDKSGGERTRLLLEQIFLQNHDVLLLDEPTNNLDAAAKTWLLNQLTLCSGLTLIVSHDRDFIDQTADYILEIKDGQLELFSGNYSDYLARVAQRDAEQKLQYEKSHKAALRVEERLRRMHTHSDQTNHSHYNKIRDENRMAFRAKRNHAQNTAGKIIRSAQSELERLQEVKKPVERKTYQAKLSADFLRRRRLLKITDLAKRYSKKELFNNLSFEIFTGQRYRVCGDNGAGKTTLFKILLQELSADAGEVTYAPELKLGYISQEVYGLDLNQTFLAQAEANTTEIYQAAVTMDLTGADLKVPCGQLSRGQLTKLAFLKIILSPVDLLILDEPTNHLDIRARENIERALADYAGAILLATHDERLAEQIKLDDNIILRDNFNIQNIDPVP